MTQKKHLAWVTVMVLSALIFLTGQTDTGSFRTATFNPRDLASVQSPITYIAGNSLADELQWHAVQTAYLAIYNMAQTGDFTLDDPYDYYQPSAIRDYLTSLSGAETRNMMTYDICLNYAQLAYNDISRYQVHYEKLGMRMNGWYIAGVYGNSREITLFDPVSREQADVRLNRVYVKTVFQQNVRAHGDATYHAWLWVYGNNGTIYWIDPTWTDNARYGERCGTERKY
jgi:hypothetical protein